MHLLPLYWKQLIGYLGTTVIQTEFYKDGYLVKYSEEFTFFCYEPGLID